MNESSLHPAVLEETILLKACTVRRSRASGPGGQNRNKVETAIHLTHLPTGITAAATERRSQAQNQAMALFRLRINLAIEVRCEVEPGREPSALWRSRCQGGRIALNPEHHDFPSMLAEAMDVLAMTGFDFPRAALMLGASGTQLVKLLKHDQRALQKVNAGRESRGLPAMR